MNRVGDLGRAKGPARFALIGAGWRADYYRRIALACSDLFELAGVATGNDAAAERVTGSSRFVVMVGSAS